MEIAVRLVRRTVRPCDLSQKSNYSIAIEQHCCKAKQFCQFPRRQRQLAGATKP